MNFRKMLAGLPHAMTCINIDNALKYRYIEEFESEWKRVYDLVEQRKAEGTFTWDKEKSDKIRKEAFQKSLSACYNVEASSLVSDDFGLMYDAKAMKVKDKWLDELVWAYECCRFPHGEL